MLGRPTPAEILRARQLGACPWCRGSTAGVETDVCPECGHHLRAALGPPDPGTPGRARVAMLLALVLIVAVAVVQQIGGSSLAAPPAAGPVVVPPEAQFEITAKVFTRFQKAFKDKQLGLQAVKSLDSQASAAEDQLRVAMLAGELIDTDEALKRIDALEGKLASGSPLWEDIGALREIYAGGEPSREAAERLRKNHGYFGDLVVTRGLPEMDPARQRLIGGGVGLFFLILFITGVVFMAFIAGTVLLVMLLVGMTSGRTRPAFVPPMPGGSLAIEMVAVFALGFLILKAAAALAEMYLPGREALWFGLVAQWGLLAVVLWPRFRGAAGGMSLMGWHRGRGVLKEIGCGVVGYLACVPLFLGGVVVSLVLSLIEAAVRSAIFGKPPSPPSNPVFDIVSGRAGVLVVVMVFFLASLWAPIVEETVFRGCMYRHLRSRWRVLPAALGTALCFGVMHAYPILMMGPVIALGFGFALIREWRGSLIASMTAHCIHNAAVLGMLLVALKLMG